MKFGNSLSIPALQNASEFHYDRNLPHFRRNSQDSDLRSLGRSDGSARIGSPKGLPKVKQQTSSIRRKSSLPRLKNNPSKAKLPKIAPQNGEEESGEQVISMRRSKNQNLSRFNKRPKANNGNLLRQVSIKLESKKMFTLPA